MPRVARGFVRAVGGGMHVDHGRLDVSVPRPSLNRRQVAPRQKQVTRKGMPQGVRRHPFEDRRPGCRLLDRIFQKTLLPPTENN